VVAATVNRHAALHDLLKAEYCFDPAHRVHTDEVSATGRHADDEGLFTTAYFAEPAEVPAEFSEAGLDDPERGEAVMSATRRIESEPALLGASGHVLTAGRRRP
jgi:hypothetical protein